MSVITNFLAGFGNKTVSFAQDKMLHAPCPIIILRQRNKSMFSRFTLVATAPCFPSTQWVTKIPLSHSFFRQEVHVLCGVTQLNIQRQLRQPVHDGLWVPLLYSCALQSPYTASRTTLSMAVSRITEAAPLSCLFYAPIVSVRNHPPKKA